MTDGYTIDVELTATLHNKSDTDRVFKLSLSHPLLAASYRRDTAPSSQWDCVFLFVLPLGALILFSFGSLSIVRVQKAKNS